MALKHVLFASVLAIFPLASGCVVETHDNGPPTGDAELRWTIASAADPGQCDLHAASSLEVRLYDAGGNTIISQSVPCQELDATFEVPIGTYTGTMTLTDGSGNPRTTTIDLAPFDVDPGSTTVVDTDFPSNSFY